MYLLSYMVILTIAGLNFFGVYLIWETYESKQGLSSSPLNFRGARRDPRGLSEVGCAEKDQKEGHVEVGNWDVTPPRKIKMSPEKRPCLIGKYIFQPLIFRGHVVLFRGKTYTWTFQGVPNDSVTGCQFTIALGLIGTPWKGLVAINILTGKRETKFINCFHHRLYRSCNQKLGT